ncbi:MAG: DUF924 family protein [Alphaproteobacteria bacterium]
MTAGTDGEAAGTTPAAVLDFWLGAAGGETRGRFRQEWFTKDPDFDATIRTAFADAVGRALAGGFAEWEATGDGTLALLILLDQFPRNLFRGTARAFAGDARARAVADRALARGCDRGRPACERIFFYLPFEHSELMADQDRSCALFGQLAGEENGASYVDYAERHRDVIRRFGRFPHRNAALGRASTPEEEAFLKQPNSSF